MTGKSYAKTRIVVSDKLLSPLANRKSFNEAAIAFRKHVNASVLSPSLNANISVKALSTSPSKGNTDGKKRTNKAGIPGVETIEGGYRYNPKQKWEQGKVLKIHTSYGQRMNQRNQSPNWGWVDEYEKEPAKKNNAEIVIKKFKVNPKTGEKIDSSEEIMSPFTVTGKQPKWMMGTKQLPGRSIGQIMSGRSLLQTAARAIGVLTDADGKLRCPPGTPAANQFTDATGSNCFGFTASELYDLAQRIAHEAAHIMRELDFSDSDSGLSSGAAPAKQRGSLLNTARSWRKLIGDALEESREVPWMKDDGEQIIPSQWELDAMPDEFRWFKDGARRGRRGIRDMREKVKALKDRYGVGEPTGFDRNADLIDVCDRMRADGIMTTEFIGRPQTQQEWLDRAAETLIAKFGKSNLEKLTEDQIRDLLNKEIELQFEIERAMLSEFLRSYTTMPDHMRTVGAVAWHHQLSGENLDEATAIWRPEMENGLHTTIRINPSFISYNTQKYLPALLENERLRIEAIGGGSDSENAAALHDFLVSSLVYSKQTAALIGGTESFARHIMAHEISHTVQLSALIGEINDELARAGRIRYFDYNEKKYKYISGDSIKDLSNEEISALLLQIVKQGHAKQIIPSLQKVIDDAENMRFLAGKYVDDLDGKSEMHQALEIMAELGALRTQGIIHGKEVDDALAFMDRHIDTRFSDERGISHEDETARMIDFIDYAQSVGPDEAAKSFRDPLWTDERVYAVADADEINRISSLTDEDEIVDFIADKEFEIEQLTEAIKNNPNDTELGRRLKDAKDKSNLAKKRWKELNDGVDSAVLQEKVRRNRDEKDKLSPEILKKRNDQRDLEKIKEAAEKASEDDIVNTLAYIKNKLADKNLSQESRDKLNKYVSIYRKAFAKKKSDSGDTRNPQAIARELDKRVNERLNPPKPKEDLPGPADSANPNVPKSKTKKPKPIKRPKNEAAVTRHTKAEREKLLEEATDTEAEALYEMSDPTGKAIADILDPEKRIEAIERIRTRNDTMQALGLDPDPMAHNEGSLEEQMENILMPLLDILERSEISGPVEIETTINLTDDQINGKDVSPISVDSLITGRLIDGQNGYSSGEPGLPDEKTGKIPHRVVIQTDDGQRGYYPHWSDSSRKKPSDYEQKVVLPPGKLEIVDRVTEKDGSTTLIARVVSQKSTEEILSDLVPNADSPEMPPGAGIQIQRSVNKHMLSRRERGLSQDISTPKDEKEIIQSSNDLTFDTVNEDGGSFGTQLDADTAESAKSDIDDSDSEVFGPPQTREERRAERAQEFAELTERIKQISANGESDEELGISAEDIDPDVLAIIENSTPEELEQILAEEAELIHQDLDVRPRDVVDEDGLEEIINPPVPEPEKPSKPTWDTTRRPRDGESSGSRPNNEMPEQIPADVDPETGEIIRPEETDYKPKPVLPRNNLPKNFIWRSGYKDARRRNHPTRIIERFLEGEIDLYQAKKNIQERFDTSTANNRLLYLAQENFGTTELSEMTPEQIVWLMDHAFYDAAQLRREYELEKNKNRGNQSMRTLDLKNKQIAMSRLQSELQNYLDFIYYEVNGKFYYPNGEWNNWGRPTLYPSGGYGAGMERPRRDIDLPDDFGPMRMTDSIDGDWDDDLTPDERRFLMDNPGQILPGMSSGARASIAGRVARKLIRPAIDRLDVDDETKDRITMVAEYTAAVASKGPTGALVNIAVDAARRGGRDVAELTVRKLVSSGKITEEQARIAMSAVDKVAPDGLPEPVKDMLVDGYEIVDKFIDERVLTDENKERLIQATDDAREKLVGASEKARDAVGDAAKKAKEKTRKGMARLRDRKRETDLIPSVDDVIYEAYSEPDDPFGSAPDITEKPKVRSAFDELPEFDPFADTTPQNQIEKNENKSPRFIRRSRRSLSQESNRQQPRQEFENDPFAGLSSGGKSTSEILDDADKAGVKWRESVYGEARIKNVISYRQREIKHLSTSGEFKRLELSDASKALVQRYVNGEIFDEESLINGLLMSEGLSITKSSNIPPNLLLAVRKQIAVSRNDAAMVSKIDKFQTFLDNLPNMPDEELADLIIEAGNAYGQSLSAPIIQTPNASRIISGGGGLTVHNIDEMEKEGLIGTSQVMGRDITISARRKAESNLYGFPFTGEFDAEDPKITALRPISGHSVPSKDIVKSRNSRLKSIYGDSVEPTYTFPVGRDLGKVSSAPSQYGESHIALSDDVKGRTKIVSGDSIDAASNRDNFTIANADNIGNNGIGLVDTGPNSSFGLLFSHITGAPYSDIAGPMSPYAKRKMKYNETATLGTFSPDEVSGIYVGSLAEIRKGLGDFEEGTIPGLNLDGPHNLSLVIDAANTHDELSKKGIQVAFGGVYEFMNTDNVELFNSTFTRPWLDRYKDLFEGTPSSVLIPENEPETTPYEALLRHLLHQAELGNKDAGPYFALEKRDGRSRIDVLRDELDRAVKARKLISESRESKTSKTVMNGLSSGGTSSGESVTNKNVDSAVIGKVSKNPVTTISGKRRVNEYGQLEERTTSIKVYDVGGKKLAFGNDQIDDPEVEILPVNPYAISGLDEKSDDGRDYAVLWFDATIGQMEEDPSDDAKTSALLYSASRGDSDAKKELERLAEVGRKKMEQTRESIIKDRDRFKQTTRSERDATWYQRHAPAAMIQQRSATDKWDREEPRPIDLEKDVYMIHQTSYMPEIDPETGDYIIRPAEDHEVIDPETGKQWIDPVTGKAAEVHRGSVHFSLNHIVGGHMYRQTPTNKTYIVIIPAQRMIQSNDGALDNLYAIDSWMTPKPGEGLRLPKDAVRIIELPGTSDFGVERPAGNPLVDWTPEQSSAFSDAVRKVEEASKTKFKEGLLEVSRAHTGNPHYEPREFPSGMHGSDSDIDLRIRDIAEEVGVSSQKHDGSASAFLEGATSTSQGTVGEYFHDTGYVDYSGLSKNARMRIAKNGRFNTSKLERKPISDDEMGFA